MDYREELQKLFTKHGLSGCDTGTLGFVVGHLTDHGLSDKEILSLVALILGGIRAAKQNPEFAAHLTALQGMTQR